MVVLFISGCKQLSLLKAFRHTACPHLFVHSEAEVLRTLILEGSAQHSLQAPFVHSGRFTVPRAMRTKKGAPPHPCVMPMLACQLCHQCCRHPATLVAPASPSGLSAGPTTCAPAWGAALAPMPAHATSIPDRWVPQETAGMSRHWQAMQPAPRGAPGRGTAVEGGSNMANDC